MIIIKNRQRTVAVDVAWLQKLAEAALAYMGYEDFDLSIIVTNDRAMRVYNRTYRSLDKSTDILSFPFHEHAKPGRRIRVADPEERILGDLIISAPYVVRASKGLGVSFDERLKVLLVHGLYHLCGYTHDTDATYRTMRRAEQSLLAHLNEALSTPRKS